MYNIVGISCGNREVLEHEIDDYEEALNLVTEYRFAYGSHWVIRIEGGTQDGSSYRLQKY